MAYDGPLSLDSGLENRVGEMNKNPRAVTLVQTVPKQNDFPCPVKVGGRDGWWSPDLVLEDKGRTADAQHCHP